MDGQGGSEMKINCDVKDKNTPADKGRELPRQCQYPKVRMTLGVLRYREKGGEQRRQLLCLCEHEHLTNCL